MTKKNKTIEEIETELCNQKVAARLLSNCPLFSCKSMSCWSRESDAFGRNSFPGKGNPKLTDEKREIADLKKILRNAELESEILKKAIAILS